MIQQLNQNFLWSLLIPNPIKQVFLHCQSLLQKYAICGQLLEPTHRVEPSLSLPLEPGTLKLEVNNTPVV
jgi:hypothetical protein